ncbi:hypothetical protein PYCCODRAFT_1358860, partial [Trametes coccinea BRFM310]
TDLIEGLIARIALLEDELVQSEHREIKLRELLHSTEFLLNEYRGLFAQVNETLRDVSGQLGRMQVDCMCRGGCLGLSRSHSR